MSVGVVSGKYASVASGGTPVPNLSQWGIGETQAASTHVDAGAQGGTRRAKGPRDWTGSMSQKYPVPAVKPGEEFTFSGYISRLTGPLYSGPAICTQVAVNWDWAGGQPITSEVQFAANGELTVNESPSAGSVPTPAAYYPSIDGRVEIVAVDGTVIDIGSGSGSDPLEVCAATASLTITQAVQSYVNSCTNGATERTDGSYDWTLALNLQEAGRFTEFDLGNDLEIRLYITDTLFWSLKAGQLIDITGITADAESSAIVAGTWNIGMQSVVSDGSGGVEIGHLIPPVGLATQYWPPS